MESVYKRIPNGLRIHSFISDDHNLPALLFLHGYPVCAYLWRKCIPGLSNHFSLFAPDLPGFGESETDLKRIHDYEYYQEFLNEYLHAYDIRDPIIVAHDFGAMIALKYASQNPDLVKKLIILDTLPYGELPDGMQDFYDAVRSPLLSKILLLGFVFRKTFFKDARLVCDSSRISGEDTEFYHSQWIRNKHTRKAFSIVLNGSVHGFTDPIGHLTSIKCDVLILWGKDDQAFPVSMAEKLNGDIPGSELYLIDDCGHFISEEKPGILVEKILKFST